MSTNDQKFLAKISVYPFMFVRSILSDICSIKYYHDNTWLEWKSFRINRSQFKVLMLKAIGAHWCGFVIAFLMWAKAMLNRQSWKDRLPLYYCYYP